MKKLLAILCLTVLAVPTMQARPYRGGNCNSCKPCNKPCNPCNTCPTGCKKCPPVRSCPGRTICVSPPCADERKPCDFKECVVEELPVRAFRKCKTCTVKTCGPIEFECPATDEVVQKGPLGDDVMQEEAGMQQEATTAKKRGRNKRR